MLYICRKNVSLEENKTIVRRFFEELWNGRKLETADELFAGDTVTHQLESGSEIRPAPRNAEAMKEHIKQWLKGFPDLRFVVEQTICQEDRVVSQCAMQGTHTGTWSGIAPTNQNINIRMIIIHRIEGGKIVEDWVVVESYGFFRQLGLTPAINELLAKAAE